MADRKPPQINELWEHHSGRKVIITNLSFDANSCDDMPMELVTYRHLTEGKQWTHTLLNFMAKAESGQWRFTDISNPDPIKKADAL